MGDTDRTHLIVEGNFDDGSPENEVHHQATGQDPSASQADQPTKFTSQLSAFLITVNVTIGAGLLALPFAMQTSGLITSIILQAGFLTAVVVTCIMCTELTVKTQVDSYHRVIKAHCHDFIYKFTQASILLIVFGTVVAYIVIIGDQSDRIFSTLYGHEFCYTWYLNRRFVMITSTFSIILPLCCAKTVDFLKYGSFAGIVTIAFIIYVVISSFVKNPIAKDVNYLPKDWFDVASILPAYCLAYQCHISWVPTAATIRKEEKRTTYVTITLAMIVVGIVYTLVSALAVLTFGNKIKSDLTESFEGDGKMILLTIGVVAFKCAVTLPPAFLPARLSIIDIMRHVSPKFAQLNERAQRLMVAFTTLKIALVLALFVPDILVAVNILGFLAVSFIFNLPALSYLNHIKENRLMKQELEGDTSGILKYTAKDKAKLAISYFFILFGSVITVMVLYKSIMNIINSKANAPLCYH